MCMCVIAPGEYSSAAVKHIPAEMFLRVGAFSWSWGC